MTSRMRQLSALSLVATLLSAASAPDLARAQSPSPPPRVVVLDSDLRPVRGTLAGIAGSTVRVRESRARVRTLERAALVLFEPARPDRPDAVEPESTLINGDDQIAPSASSPTAQAPAQPTPGAEGDEAARTAGLLELTDGQRWPGTLVKAQGETLTWRGPAGVRSVQIERVRRWTRVPGIVSGPLAARDDLVILTNKDRLEGFIAAIDSGGDSGAGELTLERRGKAEALRLDTIAIVAPASKDAAQPTADVAPIMVWLRGPLDSAAIVAATDVSTDVSSGNTRSSQATTTRLTFAGTALGAVDPANISAIRLRSDLTPLASLAFTPAGSTATGNTWQPEPIVRGEGPAAEIELLGPGEWSWTVPQAAGRLSTTIALASEATAWGDVRITIESAGQRWQGELKGAGPLERDMTLAVSGSVRIRIEAGSSGAVGARVVLRRAVVETSR
ncbi:MAG: hypothetical protein SFY95_05810 [Planctomycetota bacterium]|nr:hypothetical protein [Planctomycetota bacterium]